MWYGGTSQHTSTLHMKYCTSKIIKMVMVQNFEVTSKTFNAERNCILVTVPSKKKSINNSNRFIGLYIYNCRSQ
jgi:hypothetical protein